MVLICSCKTPAPKLNLLSAKVLSHFPSASALEWHHNELFVFGDDATHVLVLDSAYNEIKKISYVNDTINRLPKATKQDIEAAALLPYDSETYLYAFGSQSTDHRKNVFVFPLHLQDSFLKLRYNPAPTEGIKELNIEGAAFVNDLLVLANRANATHKDNYLLIQTFMPGDTATGKTKAAKLVLPGNETVKGVSGLFYVPEKDLLFFTASEEATPSATKDGAIGDSYLGWITNYSTQMYRKKLEPNEFINLSKIAPAFSKQKIESVCVERIKNNTLFLYLAADNDNGTSTLFKASLTF